MSTAKKDAFTEEDYIHHEWQIVSVEDWILRRKLRDDIAARVNDVIRNMLEADSIHTKEKDPEPNYLGPPSSIDMINGYLFPIKTWTHMMEDDRLPRNCKQGRIIYELDRNRLRIREIASPAHDAAANALNASFTMWSTNMGTAPESLEQLGQGSNNPMTCALANVDWYFQAGSEKSPDQSFCPENIQVGLNLAKLVPGSNTIVYPTFTIEVGRSHETYPQLLNDAELKHFSPMTSVQVWLGIKLYPSERMKVALKMRHSNLGYGSDPAQFVESDTISLLHPTDIEIIVPKNRIYFAVPPAQVPPTSITTPGRNALPRMALPYGPIDDFVVSLDLIRRRVLRRWN